MIAAGGNPAVFASVVSVVAIIVVLMTLLALVIVLDGIGRGDDD